MGINWKKLQKDEKQVRTIVCGSLGAGFEVTWLPYTPPAFPKMVNLDAEITKPHGTPNFARTMSAISMGITLPSAIVIPTATVAVAWTPLAQFPSTSIPEVSALQTTIDGETKKVTDKVTSVQNTVSKMLDKKFKKVPSWDIKNTTEIIGNISYNFNTANEIFTGIQNALKTSLEGVSQSISSAGAISVAIKNTLTKLPERIKAITDNIATTINANAKTLVSDISKNVSDVVKNLTDAITKEVNRYMTQLSANIGTFLTALMEAIKADITTIINNAVARITGIATAIKNDFSAVTTWFTNVISGFQANITSNVKNVGGQISTQVTAEVSKFTKNLTDLKNEVTATIDTKIKYVTATVDKSLADSKKEMNALILQTKTDINASLKATKEELAASLIEAKATIKDMGDKVTATAESVIQVKAQIADYANTITKQAQLINQTSADIIKIRDDLYAVKNQVAVLQSRKPEVAATTEKKSIFPFFGVMSGDSLGETLKPELKKFKYEIGA